MFKARLTAGHLSIATLRFDIYPTSYTIKRFKFKMHNQICNAARQKSRPEAAGGYHFYIQPVAAKALD